jgi:hypothetical protein
MSKEKAGMKIKLPSWFKRKASIRKRQKRARKKG